jgi:uncharacterized repeat protein (TIGR01451 family)
MKKIFISFMFLVSINICIGQTLNEFQKIFASDSTAGDIYGSAVAIDGNLLIIGAFGDDDNGTNSGSAYIYEFNGTSWIETAKLLPSDGEPNDEFGKEVSINGNRVIIASPGDDDNANGAGSAYIYEFNGIVWSETKLLASDGVTGDNFGKSVSITGDRAIIGADGADPSNEGAAYIFEFNGTNWVETAILTASDGASNDRFGLSVSIFGDKAIIGTIDDDDNGLNSGSCYIFEFNGLNWLQTSKLLASDGVPSHYFGYSVTINDTKAVVGAKWDNDHAGAAYVYEYNGTNWIQSAKLLANDASNTEYFGESVSIFGDTVIVGSYMAHLNGYQTGAAYVYKLNGGLWEQIAKLIASDGFIASWFGQSVSICGDKAVIGSFSNTSGTGPGTAYIFNINPSGVSGNLFQDFNSNCSKESNENGLSNRTAIINPGNHIIQTTTNGWWHIDSLNVGTYTITFDTTGNWNTTCLPFQTFNIVNPDSLIFLPSFGMINSNPCISPQVNIHMPTMRRCFTDQKIYLKASNEYSSTQILNNGYVDVELDSFISLTSASLPYSNLGNNLYRFVLSNTSIYPGESENFWINSTLNCNAILGQTLCMQANLFPADSCVLDTIPADAPIDFTPCSLPWDHSTISIDSWCDNDSVHFTVKNIGTGDMDCFSPMRLFIDGQYIWLDSIQLLGGETDTLIFTGDGRTWRLEVDQHPLHPGNSHPNSTIELCGNDSNWTSNLVNILPLNDADPNVDIYCGVVTGSYDPNDKTGYPLGVTDSHYVSPNGKLDYVIRFQNTGTDTAFTVVVRDTLDLDLNIFSVVSGASSHNYSFRMYGPRILEWTFNYIMLPDSTTDEPGSNGFVSFEVQQMPNLPDGTEINNEVGIYFDFNAPVITNTTSHIIHQDINSPSWTQQINIIDTACFNYNFNNLVYSNSGEYLQIINDTLVNLNILISSPIVEAGQDLNVCLNDIITLNGNGALNYVWDNGITNGISFTATTSQMYHVVGTDIHDCQNSDSLFILVYDTIPIADFIHSFIGFEITLEDSSSIDVNNLYWTIDGDSLSNQNIAQYLFTQNGSYEICLIASNDCFSDTTCQQIDITTIGIEDLNSSSGIKIYPNPTHSNFTIEISEVNNAPFEITDITGKIIYTGILKDKLTNVDLSNVADGIYLIRMNETIVKLAKN